MSVLGRYAVAALVFTGSVTAAVYATQNNGFNDAVTGTVSGFVAPMVTAANMVSGDVHLDDPASDGVMKSDDRIAASSVVTHVEVIGGGTKQRIVLLDPEGREVFTHDPEANTTIIAKDTIIPSITVRDDKDAVAELRVVTAAPAIEAPAELKQALADGEAAPDLFYREDL